MDRRKFLQSLTALGTGSALPAFALNASSAPVFARGRQPTVDENNAERHALEPKLDWRDPPRIGIVAIGGAGSAILSRVGGNLPYLSSSITIDADPFLLHGTGASQKLLAENDQHPRTVDTQLVDKARRGLIAQAVSGLDVVFILGEMEETSATDLSQIVADISADAGILSIAAAMMPIDFKNDRCHISLPGTRELCRHVNTIVPLPYYRSSPALWDGELIVSALGHASVTFQQLYQGLATALGEPGLIGIDPEDIKEMLSHAEGYAIVGCGYASGSNCGEMAIRNAINNTMLGQHRLSRSSGILLSIEGKPGLLKMKEICKIIHVISDSLPDVTLIFGATPNPMLTDDFRVTLLACGIQEI